MKDIARWALDTAKARGATYADVRVVDLRQRYLSTKNGQAAQVRESQSMGVGVRVVAEGAWGFAATDDLDARQHRPRRGSGGRDCARQRHREEARCSVGQGAQDRRPLGSPVPD